MKLALLLLLCLPAYGCKDLLAKLQANPELMASLKQLKTFQIEAQGKSSIVKSLAESALTSKLEALSKALAKTYPGLNSQHLHSLVDSLEGSKITPSEKFELKMPDSLLVYEDKTFPSFHHRHHPEALNAQIPTAKPWALGKRRTLRGAKDRFVSPPVFGSNNIVFEGSRDKHLYAYRFNQKNGKLKRIAKVETTAEIEHSPALGPNGLVYVGTENSLLEVYRFTGKRKFQFLDKIPGNICLDSEPVLNSKGTVFAIGDKGTLYAVGFNEKTQKLSVLDSGLISDHSGNFKALAVGSDGLVLTLDHDNLSAFRFNETTAKLEFFDQFYMKHQTVIANGFDNQKASIAIGPDGMIFVGDLGSLYSFRSNFQTGKLDLVGETPFHTHQLASTLTPDNILFGLSGGKISAFRFNPAWNSLQLLDSQYAGFTSSQPVPGPNGTVLATGEKNILVGLQWNETSKKLEKVQSSYFKNRGENRDAPPTVGPNGWILQRDGEGTLHSIKLGPKTIRDHAVKLFWDMMMMER